MQLKKSDFLHQRGISTVAKKTLFMILQSTTVMGTRGRIKLTQKILNLLPAKSQVLDFCGGNHFPLMLLPVIHFIEPEFTPGHIPADFISCGYFPCDTLEMARKHACLNYNLKLQF